MSITVGIFTYVVDSLPSWDPDNVAKGITGSEEAVIYLSEKLAQLGFKVVVFGNPPPDSRYRLKESNPCFVTVTTDFSTPFDIAIAWRMPQYAQVLRKIAKKVYLWPHDVLDVCPEAQEIAFDDVLWLSEWQRKQWISIQPEFKKFTTLIGNGVNLETFPPLSERKNPFSCIYASNYGRGLEVLAALWPNLKFLYPEATLDIYYGWQHWGQLPFHREKLLRKTLSQLEDVREHGQVGHQELNQAYASASLWTYPCILPETFCISALRAQFSGAVPVVIKHSALDETIRHGFSCTTVEDYYLLLKNALELAPHISLQKRAKMGVFVRNEFTWEKIAFKLKALFQKGSL